VDIYLPPETQKEAIMRIVHFCPFAPNQCGMYETTRDMIKAERMQGHESELYPVRIEGVKEIKEDRRGAMTLRPISKEQAYKADLWVSNCNIPSSMLKETDIPVVQVVHGRPETSLLTQLSGKNQAYDIYWEMGQGDRVKMFITLWKEHVEYVRVYANNKPVRFTSFPPCDKTRYTSAGPVHKWSDPGKYNILIPETWREDRGPFHILHGIMKLARRMEGLKVHIYACNGVSGPWKYIFIKMKQMGVLGEVKGIMRNIAEVYRASDLVVTSQKIGTRVVREALCSGIPVAAQAPNRHTPFTFTDDPDDIADTIEEALTTDIKKWIYLAAHEFNLGAFGEEICMLYEEAIQEKVLI
jgi:hypothetical protein